MGKLNTIARGTPNAAREEHIARVSTLLTTKCSASTLKKLVSTAGSAEDEPAALVDEYYIKWLFRVLGEDGGMNRMEKFIAQVRWPL